MINVDNNKAFHGVMRITPRSLIVPEFEIEADWLYKPEYKCWYGNGASYGEDICTVVRDDSEKQKPKKTVLKFSEGYYGFYCPTCENQITVIGECCVNCGQKLYRGDEG